MKYVDKFSGMEQLTFLHSLNEEEKYEALNEIIENSNHIVFFGGAGVSTESGIPDFRSKDGLYNQHDVKFDKYKPEYLLSRSCLYNNPKVFFEFYRQKMNVDGINPNTAHIKLAEMEKAGKLDGIITQNIDGLHQKAGSKNVQEIHGTTLRNYCVKCKKEYASDFIFKNTEAIPKCECHNMVRPDVTLYEENLPKTAWNNAYELILNADCLIVGGTSLSVFPAANFVHEYKGKHLIIINRDGTDFDQYADLYFHDNISTVLNKINI